MKNIFGSNLTLTLFGESHGTAIGAVLDGLAPGIRIDMEYIQQKMQQRKAVGKISTKRQEADEVEILSGVFNGYTTGTPLALVIHNQDTKSKDYSKMQYTARPSHADYTANCKYGGFQDYRGGGHFSGRITAPVVAAGAIILHALEEKNIHIGTHIKQCHGICDREFENLNEDLKMLAESDFPVLDSSAASAIRADIERMAAEGDSVGGVLETAVSGIPAGVGEPWFDTLESILAHGLFSIPAVKGVEFGAGFAIADMTGSEANDAFRWESGKAVTVTNNNGGINGGITNGMPVLFRTAVKPTPSIYKKQDTIDFQKGENKELVIEGRHDPAIIHRARVVVDAMTALVIGDLLTGRMGTDYLRSNV